MLLRSVHALHVQRLRVWCVEALASRTHVLIDVEMHLQDPRLEVLPCMHSGTYADDCICERIRQHKCYIVATCDRDLRRRIRKVLCCDCNKTLSAHPQCLPLA